MGMGGKMKGFSLTFPIFLRKSKNRPNTSSLGYIFKNQLLFLKLFIVFYNQQPFGNFTFIILIAKKKLSKYELQYICFKFFSNLFWNSIFNIFTISLTFLWFPFYLFPFNIFTFLLHTEQMILFMGETAWKIFGGCDVSQSKLSWYVYRRHNILY